MSTTKTKSPPVIHVLVIYNGVTQEMRANTHEAVRALLEHALNAFGIQQNRHTMSLYSADGTELNDHVSISDAGINQRDQLLLRPSAVKGGSRIDGEHQVQAR